MSKLDSLLELVDTLLARSVRLSSAVAESCALLNNIKELDSAIAYADSKIDSMSELLLLNSACINGFDKLQDKIFFLESNSHVNEYSTNLGSLDILHSEYDHLLSSFRRQNDWVQENSPSNSKATSSQPSASLRNMLSILNLELKPIKCRSTKVSKQKSKYRLSAFNLNPIDMASVDQSPLSANVNVHGNNDISPQGAEKVRDFSKSSHETDLSSLMDVANVSGYSFENSLESALENGNFSVNVDDVELDFSDEHVPAFNEFDNFEHYLRQSRIDLRTAFETRTKTPVFVPKTEEGESAILGGENAVVHNAFRFHNPAATISELKSLSQPTVEEVYSTSKPMNNEFLEQTRKFLQTPEKERRHSETLQSTPTKRVHLFSLLNSPLGSPRTGRRNSLSSLDASTTNERQSSLNSMHSEFGLANLFRFVGSSSVTLSVPTVPITHLAVSNLPPEKIKLLRKQRTEPIAINADVAVKRRPGTRPDVFRDDRNERAGRAEREALLLKQLHLFNRKKMSKASLGVMSL